MTSSAATRPPSRPLTIRRLLLAGLVLVLAVGQALLTAAPAAAIAGGTAAPQAYPFSGSLLRPADSPRADGHVCGVTLVAPRWVVTAAHCARNDQDLQVGRPVDWSVRLGSTSVSTGGEHIGVSLFVRRTSGPLSNVFGRDIALLELARPATAAPVAMTTSTPAPGTPARILGWGVTCAQASPACYPEQLRQADTRVQPASTCPVRDADLCIGARNGSVGPTNMDSGGPALIGSAGAWTLAGVVSGGGDRTPGVYTNIAAFREWIAQTIGATPPSLDGAVSLAGRCSGAVVRGAAARPDDPALLLTNGHCVSGDRPAVGSVVLGRPEAVPVTIRRADSSTITARTTELVYATMTGTDVALYRLDRSYRQLAARQVKVFTLSSTPAADGDPLQEISGNRGRGWSCAVGGVVPTLREGGYTQHDAIYEREDCGAGPGDSGSPLVDPRSGQVVGIHNTSNGLGGVCTDGNPCEIDRFRQTTVHVGRGYGQQTAGIPTCLAPGSTVDLTAAGCALTRPT